MTATDHCIIRRNIDRLGHRLTTHCHCLRPFICHTGKIKSQAVARMADRTALQQLCGSHDVIGHVTIRYPYGISYCWSFGTKPLSVMVSEIFNVECNAIVHMSLIRPLNKGQNHSFWYQSISHIRLPIGCQ